MISRESIGLRRCLLSQRLSNTLVLSLLFFLICDSSNCHEIPGLESNNESNEEATRPLQLSPYNPVLFIPGDGGSQLEAKLNKTTRVHYICDYKSDWYDIWLNIHLLVPLSFDCLIDNMMLHYNSTTRRTVNTEGVQIRPTNFGSIDSVDYLDILRVPGTAYFSTIIDTLVKKNGYIRNSDIIGAAFDFRKAPNELEQFFQDLKYLIEDHYVRNNFRQTQIWKDVFIQRLITLGAPWDGSFKAISAMLFGDNLGIPLLNKNKLQQLQSSFPSLMYLFPREPTFSRDRILVETSYVNYTLKNLDNLFNATGLLDQREMWYDTRDIAANLTAPNVEIWCLYGAGYKTPSKIVYQGSLDEGKVVEQTADGDGTVNIESLRACEFFQAHQEKPVFTRQFDGTDHITILRGAEAADFISEHILVRDLE